MLVCDVRSWLTIFWRRICRFFPHFYTTVSSMSPISFCLRPISVGYVLRCLFFSFPSLFGWRDVYSKTFITLSSSDKWIDQNKCEDKIFKNLIWKYLLDMFMSTMNWYVLPKWEHLNVDLFTNENFQSIRGCILWEINSNSRFSMIGKQIFGLKSIHGQIQCLSIGFGWRCEFRHHKI